MRQWKLQVNSSNGIFGGAMQVAVAAATQYPVEGAVVTAAGGTDEVEAEISVEAAGGQQQRYFRQIDECSSVVAVAAQDAVDETAVGGRCRWSSGEDYSGATGGAAVVQQRSYSELAAASSNRR